MKKSIGERIFDFRVKNGLSQQKFGELLEINKDIVSRIENGIYNAEKSKLLRKVELFLDEKEGEKKK